MPEDTKRNWSDRLAQVIVASSALAAVVASVIVIRGDHNPMEKLKLATGFALLIFLFFLSIVVLLDIIRNKIDLSQILEELSGGASMSRFQLLVFTFVIAFSFFVTVANKGQFPEIPTNVLALLGVSASTYAISKGLQISSGDVGTSSGKTTAEGSSDDKGNESKT